MLLKPSWLWVLLGVLADLIEVFFPLALLAVRMFCRSCVISLGWELSVVVKTVLN